jgi:hypothetical protein
MKLDWFERDAYHEGPVTTKQQKALIRSVTVKLLLLKRRIIDNTLRRIQK